MSGVAYIGYLVDGDGANDVCTDCGQPVRCAEADEMTVKDCVVCFTCLRQAVLTNEPIEPEMWRAIAPVLNWN